MNWYIGLGPQLNFVHYNDYRKTFLGIRPQIGLEYRIPNVPLSFNLDWKPWINLTNVSSYSSNLSAGRFSLGIKYCIN